eukprot:scaffold659_cov71-Cylindrotheca_fusiformis.AAC.5
MNDVNQASTIYHELLPSGPEHVTIVASELATIIGLPLFEFISETAASTQPRCFDRSKERMDPEQRRGREGGGAPEAVHEVEQQPELILLASSKQ